MNNISISEIQITLIKPNNGLIGFASLVINNSFYISSIGIHTKLYSGEWRITFPTKNGLQIFHPISKDFTQLLEKSIFSKLNTIYNYDLKK